MTKTVKKPSRKKKNAGFFFLKTLLLELLATCTHLNITEQKNYTFDYINEFLYDSSIDWSCWHEGFRRKTVLENHIHEVCKNISWDFICPRLTSCLLENLILQNLNISNMNKKLRLYVHKNYKTVTMLIAAVKASGPTL